MGANRQLVNSNAIVELFDRQGVAYRMVAAASDEVYVCCPFCLERGESEDTRFRLGINLKSGIGHCFNCGWASRYALQKFLKKTMSAHVLQAMAPFIEVTVPEKFVKPAVEITLPSDYQPLPVKRKLDELERRALNYLLSRGLTRRQIVKNKIGTSLVGEYAFRVIFPNWFRGKLQGFVGRDFTGRQTRRYLNAHGMQKILYHLPDKVNSVILFEGIFKALRAERVLRHACVAMLGNRLTEHQVELLLQAGCRRVYLWPDPDKAGVTGALESAKLLHSYGFRVFIVWPSEVADEAPLESIREAWKNRRRYDLAHVTLAWMLQLSARKLA